MVSIRKLERIFLCLSLGALTLCAQSGVRDGQALAAIGRARAALAGTVGTVSDVRVEASVHWIAGSEDETISGTFTSAGQGTSRSSFGLAGGTRVESRNQLAGTYAKGGAAQPVALHNMLNMHEWFFPQFFLEDLQANRGYSLAAPVAQTVDGEAQIAITGSLIPSGQMDAATAEVFSRATKFQLVLDGATYLPVSLSYVLHPEDDALRGPPVVYKFSEYQLEHGLREPFHIQKYLQGTLTQDIRVRSLAVNTGLTAADF